LLGAAECAAFVQRKSWQPHGREKKKKKTPNLLASPALGMSDKQNDRLEKLWQAAGKKLSDDDVEILKEEKDLLLEHKLLSSSAIEPYTKEQLKDLTFSAGCAALLKKVFPCKLSGWSCVLSYSPCIAPTMSVTV
jgi:hypothetical protein